MTRMALQFSLGPEAVSCIIPGARKIEQVDENVAASSGGGFPAEIRAQIEVARKTWDR
jgi:aryl-alcohol dehydrogenase-like predicted oxidoreductase